MKATLLRVAIIVAMGSTIACSGEAESAPPASGTPGAAQPGSGTTSPDPKTDGDVCKMPGIDGAASVKPTFKVYDPAAGVAPPQMKGGKIEGRWNVDSAIVYLPTEVKAAVKPEQSTGTLTSWAIFKKSGYKLALKTDFQIQSVAGPRPQQNDVAAGGSFKANGAVLELDNTCNPQAEKQDVAFSFTDEGERGTLVIKTKTEFGYSYLELKASRGN